MRNLSLILFLCGFLSWPVKGQTEAEGSLFIIGGGERPSSMIESMIKTANLEKEDYIIVLPMASSIPDEVTKYITEQIAVHTSSKVIGYNFGKNEALNTARIDSLKKAKLIYITGGDQNKFMEIVRNTPIEESIKDAYKNGSTIAGTSAGAAVMSKVMITGKQETVEEYQDFEKIWYGNVVTEEGLGLIDDAIIDQHFIVRSRYNRLISVLAEFPNLKCIGIDESTAILVHKGEAKVVGESQVVVLSNPVDLSCSEEKLVSFENVKFSLLQSGHSFSLKK